MELEIEVFWHNDETENIAKADIDFSVLRCDTKKITFYVIDLITPYIDKESEEQFCTIYSSGGTTFIATLSYEKIRNLIRESALREITYMSNL